MVTLVNFADKKFRNFQRWNTFSAKFFGKFDSVIEYNPTHIDKECLEINKENLKHSKKGFGGFFWKPYLVNKALQKVNDGDYLMYSDSGTFFIKSILPLVKHLERNQKDILCFRLPLIEKQWTKRDAFLLMDSDTSLYTNSPQILATFFIIKKTKESVLFLKEYEKYCFDSRILSDAPNCLGKENYKDFIEHRHDQSVFSLLCKKYKNSCIEGDISDYGYYPYKYLNNEERLFNVSLLNIKINKFKGTIISNRTQHPIIYLIKYVVKRVFISIGIKI